MDHVSRGIRWLWPLLLGGCSATPPLPAIDAIEPNVVPAQVATPIVIRGHGFFGVIRGNLAESAPLTVDRRWRVTIGPVALPLEAATLVDERSISATAPAELAPGRYDVTATSPDGKATTLAGGLTVAAPGDLGVSMDGAVDLALRDGLAKPDLATADLAVPLPSCVDGMKNASETDIDCGGLCPRCGTAKVCKVPPDCSSGVCTAGACAGGLIAYWSFDEGAGNVAKDSSGNANHGSLVNAPSWVAGKVGSSLDMRGIGYVTVSNANSLNLTGALSISAWVTAKSFPLWTAIVMKTTINAWDDGYGVYYWGAGASVCGYVVDYNGMKDFACSAFAVTNAFRHVVMTYDANTLRLYYDGNLVMSSVPNTAVTVSQNALFIGLGTGQSAWDGKIDEVRIFNRALSPQEIQQLLVTP